MRNNERGFALLLVFALSASIAIFLYLQLPRAAFEAQRDKEQLLIERGEQYTRAIQLFAHKFQRYPSRIEDLEETNGKRYLRRRYKDPMTGKDEWRMINIDAAGVLTNSLVTKKTEQKENLNTFITENPGLGVTGGAGTGEGGVNPGMRRRESDNAVDGTQPEGGQPAGASQLGQTANSAAVTPVIPQQGQMPQGANGMPPQIAAAIMGGAAGSLQPGQPGQPPQAIGPQNPNAIQPQGPDPQPNYPREQPQPGQLGQGNGPPPFPQGPSYPPVPATPGAQPRPPGAPNAALDAINRQLTTPRQQQQPAFAGAPPGFQLGGGIAGVASTAETASIKIYNEREKYNEWEFIYDPKKDKRQAMAMKMGMGQQQQNPAGGNMPGGPLSPGPPNPGPPGSQQPNPQQPGQRPQGFPPNPGFGGLPQPSNRR